MADLDSEHRRSNYALVRSYGLSSHIATMIRDWSEPVIMKRINDMYNGEALAVERLGVNEAVKLYQHYGQRMIFFG